MLEPKEHSTQQSHLGALSSRVESILAPVFCIMSQDQAGSFLVEVKASPDVWRLCTERFSVTQYPEVKFWCLQTLNEVC